MHRDVEGFTELERQVVSLYEGNLAVLALKLGFSAQYLSQIIRRSHVRKKIEERFEFQDKVEREYGQAIASRDERLAFWTQVMNGEIPDVHVSKRGDAKLVEPSLAIRLKAAELLGKANCDFSEKQILEGGDKPLSHEISSPVNKMDLAERIALLKKMEGTK